MLKTIDTLLNKITTYRLTLYYLIVLISTATILSTFNFLKYNPLDLLLNTATTITICLIANYIFAQIFRAQRNTESVFITALIITLLIPPQFFNNTAFLILASTLAMASKYLLTIQKKHLFNPAAVGLTATALISNYSATWWIGTSIMLPFVLLGGLLLVRKIQKGKLVFSFLSIYLLLNIVASSFHNNASFIAILNSLQQSISHSALFFFSFVMLTDPLTSPSTEKLQTLFAAIVATAYATPQIRLFGLSLTPEMALCLGNIYAYIVSPKYRLLLSFKEKSELAPSTYLFSFEQKDEFHFIPGQYMEWTLPHKHTDDRGNRRYFSLASSPTEKDLLLLLKLHNPSSSYKQALAQMKPGDKILASQLGGEFTLPKEKTHPLTFIAAGVGIAPFRSMIQYIIDKKIQTNIILLYSNKHQEEILFQSTLKEAEKFGVKTIYILTETQTTPKNWNGETGKINKEVIEQKIPDYQQRTFYLCGPQLMIQSTKKMLENIGVENNKIKIDYFPGYNEK